MSSSTEMPVCGYACKYTPIALLAGCGMRPVRGSFETDDLSPADTVLHPNVCSYAKAIACAALRGEASSFVFTTCCDSLRRCADVVRRHAGGGFVFLLDLPHCSTDCARELYAGQLDRLIRECERYTGRAFSLADAIAAVEEKPSRTSGFYLAVLGARLEPSLLARIASLSPLPVRDLTCMGAEPLGPAPTQARTEREEFIRWYAGALLSQGNCMRMSDGADRRALAADPDLRGIIYHGLKFCDFYSYDYHALSQEVHVPITRLETDWTSRDLGQTLTRIEALIEGLGLGVARQAGPTTGVNANGGYVTPVGKGYFVGIDSGSTSTDAVIIDRDANMVAHVVRPTGARVARSAEEALAEALRQAGIVSAQIAGVVSTGYGRNGIGVKGDQVTEITCHARGAHHIDPSCRTVIDIGGQDSKVISLASDGSVSRFAMNDKCAAGTGRFLESMAHVLELSVDELASMGTSWDEEITLTTMCTVFAESEVVSLIAANKKTPDIVHGIDASVASKTAALVKRVNGVPGYVMTGGVAQNAGVVAALSEKLGSRVSVPENPQVCGALGAALIARDRALQAG